MRVCLLANYNLYESKKVFTNELEKGLQAHGAETLYIDTEKGTLAKELVDRIIEFKPDFTTSFNSFVPYSNGEYMWDRLKIPHLALLVDPVLYSANLTKSPMCMISCVDRTDVETLKGNGFTKGFFLPHGASEAPNTSDEKIYDIVFLGSCYDYENLQKYWQKDLPKQQQEVIERAVDLFLAPGYTTLLQALAQAVREVGKDIGDFDFMELFTLLDYYTRGLDRVELIRSFKNSQVHVFGELSHIHSSSKKGWEYYLRNMTNVVLHPSVEFGESLQIIKQSKICLNSMIFFKDGSHERILNSLSCGALPVTSDSKWTQEEFANGKELIIYSRNEFNELEENLQKYLFDDHLRDEIVTQGREKVLTHHMWKNRAEEILNTVQQF